MIGGKHSEALPKKSSTTGKQSRTDQALNRSSTGNDSPVDTKGHPVRLALCDSDMRSGRLMQKAESERKWFYRRQDALLSPALRENPVVRTHEPDVYRQTVEWLDSS